MAYGYVRDKEPLSINWAEISKNFNDRLAADEAERQGKRDDIQKQYDELSQQLIDKPTGADTDLNSAIASFTTQASQASLDALNRLKRGEISEQEYYNRRANLKSSTSNLFLYAGNFNDQLAENLKLIQSQDPNNRGSDGMAFKMALAQDMLNFKNTVAIIDPATDEVMLVKTDEEGNPTNEVVSVSQLGSLSTQTELDYNYKDQVSKSIAGRGVAKYTTDDGKVITTIQGVEINPKTATGTIDKLAESLIGDEVQQRSILAQNGYKYTQDESLKGKDGYIYYDIKNNTFDVDKDAALNFVRQDINNSIPVEVKDAINPYQQGQLDRADRAFEEGVRQFDETLKLKQDELLAETNSTASNVSSPTNFFRSTSGSDVTANNYIRSINEDSIDTEQKQRDVAINLNEVLNTVGVKDAVLTINKGGEKIAYEDQSKEPISFEQYRNYGGGTQTKPSIVINIPGVTEGDIVVPVDYKISDYLEKIMNAIGNAKKTNTTIKGSDFEFIINNDFYNPGAPQEEEVVVEDEEVVVDPTKYNN